MKSDDVLPSDAAPASAADEQEALSFLVTGLAQ